MIYLKHYFINHWLLGDKQLVIFSLRGNLLHFTVSNNKPFYMYFPVLGKLDWVAMILRSHNVTVNHTNISNLILVM